ncbi:DEAD/DEAH box helicase [Paenibacillus spongiae]|uniref:SNF2 helicase associated domain-containing protein n=1 Tax=Paenibacillus spongiae TaxID=2909671 RepID=A0ABY5S4U8_9BACL|nr:DEAD/DEAH box helicase [Paenibacillus spongiae]UVI27768.1 SNF2 helicase associated domain-containing protein [Paenibacillus spongiae]
MSIQLTEQDVIGLCGELAYKKGLASLRRGKVAITSSNAEWTRFDAKVNDNGFDQVSIELDQDGVVEARCSCSALFTFDKYCKHIAAVLLNIQALRRGSETTKQADTSLLQPGDHKHGHQDSSTDSDNLQLLNGLLGLFGGRPLRPRSAAHRFDTREPLDVEFMCKPYFCGYRKLMFGIEMKVGPKRLYIVQDIRAFLDRIDRGEVYTFSRHFTYDPELHSFPKETDAVIRQLIHIIQNETMYLDTVSSYPIHSASNKGSDRILPVPPVSWETLLPLLIDAPSVRVEQESGIYEGIRITDERLPLQFEFDQDAANGYRLDIKGLDGITVMESYSIVLFEGKLLKLPAEQCKRLTELKGMLDTSARQQVKIRPEMIETFMEKVIPGLMRMGKVHIAEAVSNRIIQTPLKAKLYLDRVRDRLLAGLEFQYGSIIINPLDDNAQKRHGGHILMRDGELERRILELMDQHTITRTEAGYFMDDEEAEFDFLHNTVPQLEKLLTVYATSAVKVRLHKGPVHPKITVDVDERTDWLEIKFDMGGIPETEIRKLLQSLEEKRRYYRLPNGALLPLEAEELQEMIRFLNEVGIRNEDIVGSQFRLPVVRGLHMMDADRSGNTVKLGRSFRRLLDNMRSPDNLDFPVPGNLEPILRDYQKYGYQWLKTLAHYRFGGILADDMGLGKTLQSIAFVVSVLTEIRQEGRPAIIVAPASLVYNWRNEFAKFAPGIKTVIVDGSRTERSRLLKDMTHTDVVITSYPLLRRDAELYVKHAFHTLFLDEAQMFKNHTTQTAQTVKLIQARYRYALTGTPMENRLEELWSIFDVIFPGLFPDLKGFHDLSREAVARRIRPFLLRRLKSDVLKELPDKIETLQASELLPEQKKLYVAYLAKLRQETVKHLNDDSFQQNRIRILAGLTRLRQLCCHPALFVDDYAGSSAKFEQLQEIVEECRNAGRRVLVFSQFTQMLGLIGRELGVQGVPYFYLDGQTPGSERVELCTRFNDGERELFLISLKAGGTGLNLTGADTVILYDLWWNPAVEQQAADRAHRIGQQNVVQVIRLVAQGTVEDKMFDLQQRKINLIDEVIRPGEEALSGLTEQDIREILMIE